MKRPKFKNKSSINRPIDIFYITGMTSQIFGDRIEFSINDAEKTGFLYWKKKLPLPNINKKQSQVEKWPKWEKQSYKAFGRQYRKIKSL